MSAKPLCSVITSTWARHGRLLNRCMPAVQAQDYPRVEHVIVSDAPDGRLGALISERYPYPQKVPIIWDWLDERPAGPHWGSYARLAGLELARGDYIAYCDDDDALRPQHCRVLAEALDASPGAGFAYTRMLSRQPSGDVLIGNFEPPVYGQIGSPMIMHRRELADVATWGEPDAAEDWKLVEKWLAAGVSFESLTPVTVDVYPSTYAHLEE